MTEALIPVAPWQDCARDPREDDRHELGHVFDEFPAGRLLNSPNGDGRYDDKPTAGASGESAAMPAEDVQCFSTSDSVTIWSVNLQGAADSTLAVLHAHLEVKRPHLLLVQETWWDISVGSVPIPGYSIVSRRDRVNEPKPGYGGIAVYRRNDFENIVPIESSEAAERSWCCIHTSSGPYLVGNWYRPDDAPDAAITSLRHELEKLLPTHCGVILCGDMNIHHRKWLKFSSRGNTRAGELPHDIVLDMGLTECVRKPTRIHAPSGAANLLDLVLADCPGSLKTNVSAKVADHCMVECTLDASISFQTPSERWVWHYKTADWEGYRKELSEIDWGTILHDCSLDTAARRLTDRILEVGKRHISYRRVAVTHSSQPWRNECCRRAILARDRAVGTVEERNAAAACSSVLREAQAKHRDKLREKLRKLPRSSKAWWRINRELMTQAVQHSGIPPLQDEHGSWMLTPGDKANLLARTFENKCELPEGGEPIDDTEPSLRMNGSNMIRRRWAFAALKNLETNKATGPDTLPARLLKAAAKESSIAVAIIARRCVQEHGWPDMWRDHWVHALYKKRSPANPENYRGIHLTAVLSKVVERTIGRLLVRFLDEADVFGASQWAFRPKRSCRDVVVLLICTWILNMTEGYRTGILLTDIFGAFDRVETERLIAKLRSSGVSNDLVEFLRSYLAARRAFVIVSGQRSTTMCIRDQVFQGTVLGPPLWNVYFKDVDGSVPAGFSPIKFADDLTVHKRYPRTCDNAQVFADLHSCQSSVHDWGTRNRVKFDPGKEEIRVIDVKDSFGDPFRLLGVQVDCKLLMNAEADRIVKKARPKLKALLRTRAFNPVDALISQYKAHILPLLEGSALAIYHASQIYLDKVDRVQDVFLREICMTDEQAFLDFNLAPVCLRRDIAAQGFLHKIALRECHPAFRELFPQALPVTHSHVTRGTCMHTRAFKDRIGGGCVQLMHKSLFGAIRVYNDFPQNVVDAKDVSTFQSALTELARERCRAGSQNWQTMFRHQLPLR